MKKIVLICLSFLVLIGCSTNYSPKLSGKEVDTKLKKLGIDLYDNNDDGFGYIVFNLTKIKDNSLLFMVYYSDGEVTGFRVDENGDEYTSSYVYDIDKDYSYVNLLDEKAGTCKYAIDGKAPKGKVCSGKRAKEAKRIYKECYTEALKQLGITKEDLITFGNWYYENNSN